MSDREHLYEVLHDALSPNWEIDSSGYNEAVDAILASWWLEDQLADAFEEGRLDG